MYFPYLRPQDAKKPVEGNDTEVTVRSRSHGEHGDSKTSRFRQLFIAIVVIFGITVLLLTSLLGNLFSLVANRGYFIPRESSVLSFRVLVDNPGSGEWWLVGEDWTNFYAIDEKEPIYYVFPKRALHKCPKFAPADVGTWCPALTQKSLYP